MIKAGYLLPGFGGVACLAALRGPIRTCLPHAIVELTFVRIFMASRAGEIVPMVLHRRLRLQVRVFPVTIAAGDCRMTPGKGKLGFFVPGERKGRWLVSLQIMTTLAGVKVRRLRELPGMLVAMAIGAALELHLEQGVLPPGNMALSALQCAVASFQRVRRGRVIFYGELRRLESVHGMT
jgi:hypothetical protein